MIGSGSDYSPTSHPSSSSHMRPYFPPIKWPSPTDPSRTAEARLPHIYRGRHRVNVI